MNLKKMNDQELLRAYSDGNEGVVSVLFERHRKRVFDYIRMMVKDADLADDLLQETFIKVLNSLRQERYTDNGKFVAWVMRIAHNQIIDHFRRQKQQNHVSNEEAGYDLLNNKKFSDQTIEDHIVSEQINDDIRRLVEFLPDEQREVVMLRHYNDMSFKEIAEQTGVSINTALGRMRYALINLRKLINEKQLVLQ
ncbi:MAG: sigma-70 family RNA polymerase sigma factor [Rikenellaceae bacterium]|jgi:RNA polymerase sigma-70 factor (ECF subfamily)|nr:sigma-70 family RNA polymerase sigma factor [Rikenellaceae bacterium]